MQTAHARGVALDMFMNLWTQRHLIVQLTKRDVLMRYRGSFLGLCWSFLTPLMMLVVYTFVFGVIFKARWDIQVDSKMQFALIFFCGLTTYNVLAETVARAAGIILGNPNYIKKVVFPLEILPVTVLGASLVNALIGIVILIVANFVFFGKLYWTVVLIPLVFLPLVLFTVGLAWFLASLGVYLRDICQVIPVFVTALMFLSPIFYPVSVIP